MYNTMEMDEFYEKQKSEELNILDVREKHEYEKGHIPSAKNMPLSGLKEHVSKLDNEKDYMIICHAGGRSKKASEFLSREGLKVTNVLGGMSAWEGEIEQDAGE